MRKQSCRHARLVLRPITLAVLVAFGHGASANPTGPQVAAGSATFQSSGAKLTVTNAPGTIINWQSFSIGNGEHTRFLQQSASSAVLNRVVGADGSSILGSLTSNGRVFLVNPHGIIFGAGAWIDTAGFIASTLNMADRDFLEGRLRFEGGGNGILRNDGEIRASGDIMLVGPTIENAGLIRSETGNVLLAAGKSVTITSPDAQGVKFEVQAPTDSAVNLGTIEASSAAAMFAGTLEHSGEIRATQAKVDAGGRVVLVAQKEAIVQSGGVISANGGKGGEVTVRSGDLTSVAGKVEAKGSASEGGNVQLLGNRVAVQSGASVDASGETGGGTILVGGDYQGKNADVQNAWRTYVGPDSTMRADAVASGDGGKVIVWADDSTRFHGKISARGGAQSGDGGLVETSGKGSLTVSNARVDTRAPNGRRGTWLLDPKNIEVVVAASATGTQFGDDPAGDTQVDRDDINAALSDVVLQAHNDITFSADISIAEGGVALTAQAGRSIFVNADITTDGGDVTLIANETSAAGVNPVLRDPFAAQLAMADGRVIEAGTGSVFLRMADGSGPLADSGDITAAEIRGTSVSIRHNGPTADGRIVMSGPLGIVGADNVYLENTAPGPNASIGTSPAPVVIDADRLEAKTENGTGGIFVASPNAVNLEIGGVPGAIYDGAERGVQALAGGPIAIDVIGGNLTGFAGTGAVCGAGAGTGGPICTSGADITLTAAAIGIAGAGNRIQVNANDGTVFATSTDAAVGGVFLHKIGGNLAISRHTVVATGDRPIELSANSLVSWDATRNFNGSDVSLFANSGGTSVAFTGATTVTAGSLTINAPNGPVQMNAGMINFDTPVTVNGALSNLSDATANFNDTTTINGPFTVAVTPNCCGVVNFNGSTILTGSFELSSGTVGGSGAVMLNGPANIWSGGTLANTGGISASSMTISGANPMLSGRLDLSGGGPYTMASGALTIASGAILALTGAGDLVVQNGAHISNNGLFDIRSDAGIRHTAGATPTFTNSGTLRKSVSAGESIIGNPVNLTNAAGGVIDVQSGTLLVSNGMPTNDGTINIDPGATLSTSGAPLTNAGTIGGSGTLNLGGATLVNDGTLRPGPAGGGAGVLMVTGNLQQGAGGTYAVEIAGLDPGAVDRIVVSGSAALAGTLDVSHIDGISPNSDTSYTILAAGAGITGDFTSKDFPSGYAPFYTAGAAGTSYLLSLGDIVNAWTGTTGAWENAANWSLGHVPTAGEDALIPDVGALGVSDTVTMSDNVLARSARRVTSAENLSVIDGIFTLGPLASTIDATFSVSGSGSAILNGPISANSIELSGNGLISVGAAGTLPNLAMSGGFLTRPGGGDLTILGPFAGSGGMVSLSNPFADRFITAGVSTITNGGGDPITSATQWRNTGLLNLNGELVVSAGSLTNAPTGTLNVNSGGLLDLSSAQLLNQGELNINTDAMTPFGVMPSSNPILNTGVLNKNGPDFVNLFHVLSNTGTGRINVNAGTLSVAFGGTQSGQIEIAQGAQLNTDGALTNAVGGVIGGRGTIRLFDGVDLRTLTNEGSLRPGLPGSGGTLTVDGSVTNTGTLDITLAGQGPLQFGSLSVPGVGTTANLGGTLNLNAVPGYTAPDGDTFTIVTSPTVAGSFAATNTNFVNGVYSLEKPTFYLVGTGGLDVNSWISDADGNWNDANRWSRDRVPLASDRAFIRRPLSPVVTVLVAGSPYAALSLTSTEDVILNGTLSLTNPSTIDALLTISAGGALQNAAALTVANLAFSGALAGPGTVTVTGSATLTGTPTIAAGVRLDSANNFLMSGGTFTVPESAELLLSGGGSKVLAGGAAITIDGTMGLGGSSNVAINGGSQLTITPGGRFEFRSDADVNTTGGAPGTITNSGTIAKTLGGGTSTIGPNLNFTNNSGGTLDAQNGTLEFAGVNTFNDVTQFIGAGTNAVTSNSSFNGTITSNGLTLRSGVYSGNASFAGTTTWTGGTIAGVFTVPGVAVLNISGADAKAIDGAGATLTNAGTTNLSGGASITGAGTFQNNAILSSSIAAGVNVLATVFNNPGTVNVDAGTLRLTGSGTDVGTYAIVAGTTLDIGDGTRVFDGALALNGAGAIQVSGGTLDVRTGTLPKLDMIGGTLTRSTAGDLTIAGAFNVSGGSVAPAAGAGLLITNGVTTVTQSVGVSRSWTNNGTLSTTGAGQVNPSPGAGHQFVNEGTLNIAAANPNPFGTAVDASVVNRGTLNKSSIALADLLGLFSNSGVVNIDGGTLRLSGNGTDTGVYSIDAGTTLDLAAGTRNLNAGSNVSGAGNVLMSGATANVNAGYSAGATTISGGTASFNGAAGQSTNTLSFVGGTLGGTGNLTVNNAGTWSGGGLAGAAATLTIANGAVFALTGDTSKLVNGATIANAGTVNLSGTGNLVLNNGATFSNTGTFDAQTDADVQNTAGGATFANAGILRKSGGSGSTAFGTDQLFALTDAPASTIDVQTGTLQVNGAFPTSSGTLNVESGSTFATGGAALTNAGTLRGAGTIALAGATLTNNAVIAPGTATDSTATFTIGGNLVQGAAGSVGIELGGTAPGQFDTLSVSGSAALGGTLNLTTIGAYAPASGDIFNVLTAGASTGNFATTTKTFAHEVVPTYGATNLSLLLGPTNSNTWIFDVSDSWANAQRWSQGRAPLATDNVVINRPAGEFTITVPGGTFGALTLNSNENLTLLGTLGLTGASVVNGTLAVNGGTLQGPAPVTVNGTLALNGGTIANAGGVTVNGSTGVSGGISQLTGSLTSDAFAMTGGGLTVAAGGMLNLVGAQPKTISGGTLTTSGTTNLSGTADTTLSGGALWDNFGTLNLGGGSRIVLAGDGAATLVNRGTGIINDTSSNATPITVGAATRTGKSFMNAGRFTKALGSADVQTLDVPMTNTGTIEVLLGALIANGFPANSGIVDIRSGASFSTAGLPLTNSLFGLLKGNGSLVLGGQTFTNNGTVAPGASPGTLTIDGNYVQGPGGTLAIELGGSAAGTDYDLLKVSGTAALDGTLVVTQSPGTVITEGSAYEFMTYASATGDFAGYSVPQGFAFQTARGPTSYTLTNRVAAPPEQVAQAMAVTQNEAVVFNERVVVTQTADNTDSDAERRTLEECR